MGAAGGAEGTFAGGTTGGGGAKVGAPPPVPVKPICASASGIANRVHAVHNPMMAMRRAVLIRRITECIGQSFLPAFGRLQGRLPAPSSHGSGSPKGLSVLRETRRRPP